jgi:hypothetical protein
MLDIGGLLGTAGMFVAATLPVIVPRLVWGRSQQRRLLSLLLPRLPEARE